MKKEQALELMNAIPPDLIEEAGVQAPARRSLPRLVRTGLIAACLCAAMVGTAFAAVAVYRLTLQRHVLAGEQGEMFGYSVSGGVIRHPMEDFSPELRAAYDSRDGGAWVGVDFETRADLQSFLGEAIPLAWPDPAIMPETSLRAVLWAVTGAGSDTAGPLKVIKISPSSSVELEDNLSLSTTMYVYTEHYPADLEQIYGRYGNKDKNTALLGTYAMANGGVAEIAVTDDCDPAFRWGSLSCTGHFVQNGVLYVVSLHGYYSRETGLETQCPQDFLDVALSRLHCVLDSYP